MSIFAQLSNILHAFIASVKTPPEEPVATNEKPPTPAGYTDHDTYYFKVKSQTLPTTTKTLTYSPDTYSPTTAKGWTVTGMATDYQAVDTFGPYGTVTYLPLSQSITTTGGMTVSAAEIDSLTDYIEEHDNMNIHFSSKQDDWCTPADLLKAIEFLGPIRLDPCSNPNSIVPAVIKYDLSQGFNGLEQPWSFDEMREKYGEELAPGIVYVNPPYGKEIGAWTTKASEEFLRHHTEVVMLVPARTDTKWFQTAMETAVAVCFIKGRLKFQGAKHSAPFPSALLYFGERPLEFCSNLKTYGWCISH